MGGHAGQNRRTTHGTNFFFSFRGAESDSKTLDATRAISLMSPRQQMGTSLRVAKASTKWVRGDVFGGTEGGTEKVNFEGSREQDGAH